MKTSSGGVDRICQFEGFEPVATDDGFGTLTIGYGHTNKAGQAPRVVPGLSVTQDQARDILIADLELHERRVANLITYPLNEAMRDALVSLDYNAAALTINDGKSPSTLVVKLNAGDVAGAAAEFIKWNRANGRVVAGLTTRRQTESAWFLSRTPVGALPKIAGRAPVASSIDLKATSRKFRLIGWLRMKLAALAAALGLAHMPPLAHFNADPNSVLSTAQQVIDFVKAYGLTAAMAGCLVSLVLLNINQIWAQQDVASGNYTPSGADSASASTVGANS